MSRKRNKHIRINESTADDMLALVTGRVLRDTKKGLKNGHLLKLRSGRRYGFLTLNKSDHKLDRYKCECECGGVVYLSHREIQERDRVRAGCLDFDCPFGAEEVKAWRNPEFSLWMQLKHLLKTCPEEVDNAWGGSVYGGVERAQFREGYVALLESAEPHIDRPANQWWISRSNPVLPYAAFNLHMLTAPAFDIFCGRSRYIMHGNSLYSVDNLATLYDLSLPEVRRMRRKTSDDAQLMELILKEKEE
jgi:hypothetical protein